ncbi:hypothetical protein GGP41_000063 [Bipolaris sorokiniana]|uniref:Uncharacterized protein n=1 Tax=Cochliobolus sativus TaxID=45130 RepID=A0A8H6DTF7_COCSA|nr:hypothetical protein GGP41_000063 [Bipolaris sorokiniana]
MRAVPSVQAMFMHLRGHTCKHCLAIDEAHYKRHQDIAEQLHAIYKSYGRVDWTIIPSAPKIAAEETPRDTNNSCDYGTKNDRIAMIAGMLSSKREKKDAKRLVRAADRSRVITQEEIQYIDSVIHSADGMTSNETEGRPNPEEVDGIEKQLRYHTQVYNARGNRDRLESLTDNSSKMQEAEFDAEMDRILNVFHIARSTKELENFLTLVNALKLAITENIAQVKRDIAEVRMRRAGYLRYVNRASYEIVADRYSTKSWKTGEKSATSAFNPSKKTIPATENNASSSERTSSREKARQGTALTEGIWRPYISV